VSEGESDRPEVPPITDEEREEIDLLLSRMPLRVQSAVREHGVAGLIEIVLDVGRVPTARYRAGAEITLDEGEVNEQELDQTVAQLSEFGEDNRAGIPRTLHRVSAIRNRRGRIVGLTCRVGRSVSGSASAIRDLGRLQKVDELFDLLKRKRELWKSFNPNKTFPGVCILQVDENVPAIVVKSVFQTAAYAGYPNISFMVRKRGKPGGGKF